MSSGVQMREMTGSRAFNHESSSSAEAEYDRLRDLARAEASKRGACFDKSHQAYESGDGARAHQLSEEGKEHGRKMEQYNKQASDYIFRENNATGRVADDTIDLHGQFVEEAEDLLEARIRYAQQNNQSHLHVIVGKGNHSVNHVQKIKPRVEQVCQQLGLQYATEDNAGRIYINLQGGPATMPPESAWNPHQQGGQHQGGGQHQHPNNNQQHQAGYQPQGGYPGAPQQQHQAGYQLQGGYPGAPQQQHGGQNQQQQGDNDNEQLAKKLMKKLEGCCVVM